MEDLQPILQLFNHPDVLTNKKMRAKKQSFLLKFHLFTQIYQKKGPNNFSEIVNKIKMTEYDFAFDIIKDVKQRLFTYIIRGFVLVFVQKADDTSAAPVVYKKMGANEHFGEKLVYNSNLKLYSAKSVSKTYVLELDLQTFYKTFSGHFKYQELKSKVQFLSSIWIFKQIGHSQIERILLLSKPYRYSKNTIIFKQGDQAEAVYVVIQGELTLYKKDPANKLKNLPFMILSKGEICACEDVLEKTNLRCGGVITSSEAVLLKISKDLFLDILGDKISQNVLHERNQLKDKLIEVKSKKSVNESLKKMHESERRLSQTKQLTTIRKRSRYHTEPKADKITQVFDMTDNSITWKNRLKHKQLRELALRERVTHQRSNSTMMRLSTRTNHSLTNDKQLLLSYLMRKERQQQKGDSWEIAYLQQSIHPVKMLMVESSQAVKNHKRKLRQSRRKNVASMPVLL